MRERQRKNFGTEIVQRAEAILRTYEQEGFNPAFRLWTELDEQIGKRDDLSDGLFDLVMQLEFFMEHDPGADLSNLERSLYIAKVELDQGR